MVQWCDGCLWPRSLSVDRGYDRLQRILGRCDARGCAKQPDCDCVQSQTHDGCPTIILAHSFKPNMTIGTVFQRILRSKRTDFEWVYSLSRRTRSSYVKECLPLTCQSPVRPGLTEQ